jgi:hypothetical protein
VEDEVFMLAESFDVRAAARVDWIRSAIASPFDWSEFLN